VDSDGVIRSATTNLLLRSEEFDNAYWTKNGILAFGSGSTADAVTAPNGTQTADKIVEDTSTGLHRVFNSGVPCTAGLAYTGSFYAKAGERSTVGIEFRSAAAKGSWTVDLLTGSAAGSVAGQSITVFSAGNGWWRIVVTESGATSTTGTASLLIMVRNAVSNNYTGDGTSGLLLWGAQLEQASTVGPYIPTTSTINSAPRFDHNPLTGECLGLLPEEQRTNLLLRSEEFDNASWTKTRCSATANAGVSPDGVTTADKLVEDTSNNTHRLVQGSLTITAAATVTFSIFFKPAERSQVQLYVDSFDGVSGFAAYASASGVSGSAAFGTGTYSSGAVIALSNGWYRASITGSVGGSVTSIRVSVFPSVNSVTAYLGDGTSGLFLWGAQLEAGSGPPSSYIPTTGTAATRTADVVSITGANFSSWYRQDEGTVFADVASVVNGGRIFMFDDGVPNDRWEARFSSGVGFSSWKAGVQDGAASAGVPLNPAINLKLAAANQSNNAAIASNVAGGSFGSDTGGSTMTAGITTLRIGSYLGIATFTNGPIRRLTYWPQRLPNSTLQSITQ
jgi:hypothetical protein